MFNNVYGRNGSYVTAGQQDYAERMNQIQTQKEAYYKKVGVAPGVPTMKGAYGDPENTGVGYNAVLTELGNHDVPQGWIQTPRPNTTVTTSVVRLTSPMTKPTSPSMMPICHTVSCWLMSTVAPKTCRISSTANSLMRRLVCTIMAQGTWIPSRVYFLA